MMIPTSAMALALALAHQTPAVEFLGRASFPADARDLSGLTGDLDTPDGPVPRDRLGSLGSAIAYTGRDNLYVAAADRGPADGKSDFRCRIHLLHIDVHPSSTPVVHAELVKTILLSAEDTTPLTGSVAAIDTRDHARSARLDPEGIRVTTDGNFLISDEYGPCLDEFSRNGARLRRFAPPPALVNPNADADPAKELPPGSSRGRQPNRGMEGLAIAPDGLRAYGIMQSPLIQDHALNDSNKRVGLNIRIVEYSLRADAPGPRRQFVYQLAAPSHGVNEILAVSDRTFLVLERDGNSGADTTFRTIFKITLDGASDISAVDSLPQLQLPPEITPVSKVSFFDILDPRFSLAGSEMPEKIEGLAFGPDLPDGRRFLIVTTDNDFLPTQPTWIWAFAIDPSLLPDFEAPIIAFPDVP